MGELALGLEKTLERHHPPGAVLQPAPEGVDLLFGVDQSAAQRFELRAPIGSQLVLVWTRRRTHLPTGRPVLTLSAVVTSCATPARARRARGVGSGPVREHRDGPYYAGQRATFDSGSRWRSGPTARCRGTRRSAQHQDDQQREKGKA